MASLGVNDKHNDQIINYLRFVRYKRSEQIREIEASFEEVKDHKLHESTYTADEIVTILNNLCKIVKSDVEGNLLALSHSNVLLLKQFFQEAEKNNISLSSDITQLDDQNLKQQIAKFEEEQFATSKAQLGGTPTGKGGSKLSPLESGTTPANLLQQEISRLNAEAALLKERQRKAEQQAMLAMGEKERLSGELSELRERIDSMQPKLTRTLADLSSVKNEDNDEQDAQALSQLEEQIAASKAELEASQAELERTRKELDEKFQHTVQYANMKKMLAKKNEQIKDLRKSLQKYEPNSAPADE
eukprot:Colp12_sorted_trinity150504_noHs@16519